MNRLTRRTVAALTCGLLMLLAGPADAQQVLRWKFKPKETLKYELKQNVETGGLGLKFAIKQTYDIRWKVKSIQSDGSALLGQTITRIRVHMDGLGRKLDFDSQKGGTDQLGQRSKAIVGAEMTMSFSPRGKFANFKIPQEVAEALKKASTGRQRGGGALSLETLKQLANQMGALFPKESVSKGQTWNQKIENKNQFGTLSVETTFKYAGFETVGGKRFARFDMTPQFQIKPAAGFPGKIAIKDQGSKGKTYFDTASGRIVSASTLQNVAIELSLMGRRVSSTMKGVTEIRLKK